MVEVDGKPKFETGGWWVDAKESKDLDFGGGSEHGGFKNKPSRSKY